MDDFNIKAATREELLLRAEELGFKFHNKAQTETIRKKVAEGLGITLEAPVVVGPEKLPQGKKRVIINIPSIEGPNGSEDVKVAVNGVAYLIKRDTDVAVPDFVVEALRNARQTVYDPVRDTTRHGALVMGLRRREALSYPFNVVGFQE